MTKNLQELYNIKTQIMACKNFDVSELLEQINNKIEEVKKNG